MVLLLEMLTAFTTVPLKQGGWPIQNQGELALLYASAFAFLAAHGAGPVSLGHAIRFARTHDRRHTVAVRRQHAVA